MRITGGYWRTLLLTLLLNVERSSGDCTFMNIRERRLEPGCKSYTECTWTMMNTFVFERRSCNGERYFNDQVHECVTLADERILNTETCMFEDDPRYKVGLPTVHVRTTESYLEPSEVDTAPMAPMSPIAPLAPISPRAHMARMAPMAPMTVMFPMSPMSTEAPMSIEAIETSTEPPIPTTATTTAPRAGPPIVVTPLRNAPKSQVGPPIYVIHARTTPKSPAPSPITSTTEESPNHRQTSKNATMKGVKKKRTFETVYLTNPCKPSTLHDRKPVKGDCTKYFECQWKDLHTYEFVIKECQNNRIYEHKIRECVGQDYNDVNKVLNPDTCKLEDKKPGAEESDFVLGGIQSYLQRTTAAPKPTRLTVKVIPVSNPDEVCNASKLRSRKPMPNNCTQYLECSKLEGGEHYFVLHDCPNLKVFDLTSQNCVAPTETPGKHFNFNKCVLEAARKKRDLASVQEYQVTNTSGKSGSTFLPKKKVEGKASGTNITSSVNGTKKTKGHGWSFSNEYGGDPFSGTQSKSVPVKNQKESKNAEPFDEAMFHHKDLLPESESNESPFQKSWTTSSHKPVVDSTKFASGKGLKGREDLFPKPSGTLDSRRWENIFRDSLLTKDAALAAARKKSSEPNGPGRESSGRKSWRITIRRLLKSEETQRSEFNDRRDVHESSWTPKSKKFRKYQISMRKIGRNADEFAAYDENDK